MCHKFLQRLLLLLLAICLAVAQQQQQQLQQQQQQLRLRLPQGYNMRLGSIPTRFVGKGAYTLAGKRGTSPAKWQLPHQQQLQQQQLQQLQQQQQLQQRRQLFKWATMGGKKYN